LAAAIEAVGVFNSLLGRNLIGFWTLVAASAFRASCLSHASRARRADVEPRLRSSALPLSKTSTSTLPLPHLPVSISNCLSALLTFRHLLSTAAVSPA
jgi:hypothetical protein